MKSHMTRLKSLPSLQPSNDSTNRSRGPKSNEGPDAHPREPEVVEILRPSTPTANSDLKGALLMASPTVAASLASSTVSWD